MLWPLKSDSILLISKCICRAIYPLGVFQSNGNIRKNSNDIEIVVIDSTRIELEFTIFYYISGTYMLLIWYGIIILLIINQEQLVWNIDLLNVLFSSHSALQDECMVVFFCVEFMTGHWSPQYVLCIDIGLSIYRFQTLATYGPVNTWQFPYNSH